MKREMPTTPSLPTTAISAEAPSDMTENKDTIESMGKKTCCKTMSDSYRTSPNERETSFKCGVNRSRSLFGSTASRWLRWSVIVDTARYLALVRGRFAYAICDHHASAGESATC